jgi:Uncharacterised protein family (UPF0236)
VSPRGYSTPLQEALTDFGADEPFMKVAEKMRRHYGIDIAVSSARTITLHHAEKIEALSVPSPAVRATFADTLIVETDGSLVPCVRMDEAADDRRKTRKSEWREVKLCLARQPEKVSPVFAITTGGPDAAGQLLEEAARRAGLNETTWVHGIGDGAPWIVNQMDLRFGTQGRYLVDFYHVCEYLAAAAPVCAQDSRAWLHQQQERLKTNEVQAVLKTLLPHVEPIEQEGKHPQPVRQAHQYLSNRLQHLDYKGALERGLPIGSGEIESGHRQVVQKRIKRPGAWWLFDNAGAMANMIAARLNGVWDSYWKIVAV